MNIDRDFLQNIDGLLKEHREATKRYRGKLDQMTIFLKKHYPNTIYRGKPLMQCSIRDRLDFIKELANAT